MGRVTTSSTIGDFLRRTGDKLPGIVMQMSELDRQQQEAEAAQDRDILNRYAQQYQMSRQMEQDNRQRGLDIYNQDKDIRDEFRTRRANDMAMEADNATRLFDREKQNETVRHNKAMEARETGGPTLLSGFQDRRTQLTSRMGDLLAGAEAYDVAKGGGGPAIKDRTGLVRAAQSAANRQDTVISDAPGLFTGDDTTFVPHGDSTLLKDYLRPYDAAEDSLNQARSETFGGQQPPINVPPNDGSMTDAEYQQFVEDWKSGRVRF